MGAKTSGRGLGRGLGALFADQVSVVDRNGGSAGGDAVRYISIDEIRPNRNQPRRHFNEDSIGELADSIREHGIIQPLIVRKDEHGYELVAGERRWRAARVAGLSAVPCVTRELTDEENAVLAIIENLQREDLDPIEEAQGLRRMMDSYGFTQEQVSKSVGKSRPYISNSLRLLTLPEAIQDMVSGGSLSIGHARALITIPDERKQKEYAEKAVKEGLSVRQVEALVSGKNARKKPRKRTKDPDTVRTENNLKRKYGTNAAIERNGRKYSVRFDCYGMEELNRLVDILLGGEGE